MSAERKFFGTDGVRGPYGGPVVNEAFFARLACAAGRWILEQGEQRKARSESEPTAAAKARKTVWIGRDTRASGEALARAAMAGLRVAGLEPVDLGVLPTPAVALAVRDTGAALGVVITASHNPAGDNGIKFFKRGGLKLTDEEEAAVEALQPNEAGWEKALAAAQDEEKGRLMNLTPELAAGMGATVGAIYKKYSETMLRLMPTGAFRGWHIVLDTANGATQTTSPTVLQALGAEVVGIDGRSTRMLQAKNNMMTRAFGSVTSTGLLFNVEKIIAADPQRVSDAMSINAGCGSEHPEKMCEMVRTNGARLGIAHDGDGDRCILCDEHGDVLDGDEILVILALHALRAGRLVGDTLVVTVQSNLGVDAALAAASGRVVRTAVGDRHVAEKMRELGATLGGESSGHIICADVSPTGDGLVAALRVIEVMRATGRPLSELRRWLKKFPQASVTVAIAAGAPKPPVESLPQLTAAIRVLEARLGARGRVLARWSGTEPKLRLLVEGPDDETVQAGLDSLATAARADLGL